MDDREWGQRVCLAYVGTAREATLIEHGVDHLAPYKRPKYADQGTRLSASHPLRARLIECVFLPCWMRRFVDERTAVSDNQVQRCH